MVIPHATTMEPTNLGQAAALVASFVPAAGRDLAAERRAAAEVADALTAAVDAAVAGHGAAGEAARAARSDAVDRLAEVLGRCLETQLFMTLRVSSRGFCLGRKLVAPGGAAGLAARLAAGGVVELYFSQRPSRDELERLVEALAVSPHAGEESSATLLWDAGLDHVRFRCADETASVPPRMESGEEQSMAPRPGRARSEGSTPALHLEPLPLVAERLVRRLTAVAAHVGAHEVQDAALALLGDVFEICLAERHLALLRDALAALQAAAASGEPTTVDALAQVQARLETPRNLLALGAILEDATPGAGELATVRAVLAALPGAVERLALLLVELEEMRARQLACRALAAAAEDDPGMLFARAAGEPWYVARNMAWVLGRIGHATVVPFLSRWAYHEDERVRVEVARALAKVRVPQSIEILCRMLDDRETRVRRTAVWSLAESGDAGALQELEEILLEDRAFRARSVDERDDFFRAYGRLADAATIDELVRLLDQRQLVSIGWQAELRRGAAVALGETGCDAAARVLRDHLHGRDGRLRQACAEALRSLRNRGVAAALEDGDRRRDPERALPADWSRPGAVFRLEVFDNG
jgi:hypothetical protein